MAKVINRRRDGRHPTKREREAMERLAQSEKQWKVRKARRENEGENEPAIYHTLADYYGPNPERWC